MQTRYFPRLILTILMIFIISIVLGQAQEENLLTNPGFEDGFVGSDVASGWESWVSGDANAPGFQESPDYLQASNASDNGLIPQIRSGSDAQAMFSFFATHDAGIYQQVSGVTKGSELRFSIYGHVFSNNLADVDQSANPGGVTIRVGIDPTGGTDPFSDDIVYTEPFITYDTYIQYNVIATADNDTVTVFVRSTITEPVQNTIVSLDDAVLNVTPESSVPDETEEPTEEVVVTEEPTEEVIQEATPTREVAVETEEPTEEATDVVVTEEPTEEVVETEEPDDTPISDQFPLQITHTVVRGDTVGALATRFGSSIEAIIEVNGLNDSALIFREQELIIPVTELPEDQATEEVVATEEATEIAVTETPVVDATQYTVAPGDTLSSIARQFNTTVGALVQLNGITNQNRILVGQVLTLPGTGGSTEPEATSPPPAATAVPIEAPVTTDSGITSYVVLPGDNLYRIALRNGVSLTDLAEANNITNFNLIFIGQVLTIP